MEKIIDMRGMTAEQQDAALVLAQRNRALDQVTILEAKVEHLEAIVGRLAPVVAAVERWHDKGEDAIGIVGALQRYREKTRGQGPPCYPPGHELPPAPAEQPGRDREAVQPEPAERDDGPRGA